MIYRTSETYKRKQKIRRRRSAILLASLALLVLILGAGIAGILLGSGKAPVSNAPLPPADTQQQSSSAPAEPQLRWLTEELDEWYGINSDVVGWLSLPGCEIDDAVAQSTDNNYYLRRTIESDEYDVWGCYFLDYINCHDTESLYDKVSIIYGHALDDVPDSEKFSKLKRYKNAEFAAEYPEISFSLLEKELKFEIFAVCDIPISIDYIDPNPDEAKYQNTLNYMLDNSYVYMGVDVTPKDQILVLSTCTSDENVRFVVAGKLVTE